MTFGTLTAAFPGRGPVRYALTPRDVVWIARFIVGSGADRDPSRRQELIWRLLERFASTADQYPSLADFVLQRLPSLPRTKWNMLPSIARDLAIAAASGRYGRSPSGVVGVDSSGVWQAPTAPAYPDAPYAPPTYVAPQYVAPAYGGPVYAAPVYGRPGYAGYRYPSTVYRDHRYPVYRRGYTPWRREMEMGEMDMTPPPDDGSAAPPPPRSHRHGSNGDGNAPPPAEQSPPPPPIQSMPDPNLAQMAGVGPPDDGAGFADDGAANPPTDDPSTFTTMDGNQLTMGPQWLRGLAGRRRHHRRWRYPMSGFNQSAMFQQPMFNQQDAFRRPGMFHQSGMFRQSSMFNRSHGFGGRPIAGRVGRLVQQMRRIGNLRHRATGQRLPVFGGRVGSRNFHIVARPRGMQFEIVAVKSQALEPQHVT